MKLYLDIETASPSQINQALIDNIRDNMRPDGRASDAEASKVKKFMALMEDSPLEPLLAQVIAVNYAINDAEPVCLLNEEGNEETLINQLAGDIRAAQVGEDDFFISIVTFNGKSFDIPLLRIRAAKYGIEIPGFPWDNNKYDQSNHFDVRAALTNFDQYGRGTEDQWCLFFGIALGDNRSKGSDIPLLWEDKKFDVIRQKGITDILLLRSLFLKIEKYT